MRNVKTNRKLVCAKEIARIGNLSYAAINHYTDMGLLDVVARRSRARSYDLEKSKERLGLISRLTSEGYTLRVIAKLLKA